MKHVQDIQAMIRLLLKSEKFHALVIDSPPGWGKSSTVREALNAQNVPFKTLNSYSTPLFLYNNLCNAPSSLHVLDDCAGLFDDPTALSILKAATWSNASDSSQRVISWNTSSEKVTKSQETFSGKILLLVNDFPETKEAKAFLSRTLYLRLSLSQAELISMLRSASTNTRFFPDTMLAEQVVTHLSNDQSLTTNLNLRVLHLGYELAASDSEHWKEMLDLLIRREDPATVVKRLATSSMSVEQQCGEFQTLTGLSRRTFFNYRARYN